MKNPSTAIELSTDRLPWERQPHEGNLWFNRFDEYRLMGARERSFIGVYNKELSKKGLPPKIEVSGEWKRQALRWHWVERVELWDARILEENKDEWEQRRDRWRQQEWDLAEAMHKKVLDMMVFPIARVTREQDGKVTIIEPADWKVADIPKIASVVSKLARLATGMATERTEAIEWDPNQFTDEELEEIESTGDVASVLAKHKQRQSQGGSRPALPNAEV